MNIGFYYTPQKESGGVYQYTNTLLEEILKTGVRVTVFNISPDFDVKHENLKLINLVEIKKEERNNKAVNKTSFAQKIKKMLIALHLYLVVNYLQLFQARKRAKILDGEKLDVIFFPDANDVSAVINTPSVIFIHDLQHRIHPEFPEVSAGGQYSWRETMYTRSIHRAKLIVAESRTGKEYIQKFYNAKSEDIEILPYLPPNYLQTRSREDIEMLRKKYDLPQTFLFYPAQFWPHKNHKNLIEALHILKAKGLEINLVLTGSKKKQFGEYGRVMKKIQEYGLSKNIYHLGYVDNETISGLYQTAYALVMPTFFGPSNIPILEAWSLGCPVIYSNERGLVEQAGDAALLCNPNDPHSIAEQIEKLESNHELRTRLIKRGRQRLQNWTEADFSDTVATVISKMI